MTYAKLPNRLRVETRPIIDVAGERIGDGIAAGLLQSLFWIRHGLPLRMILILLTVVSCLLWKVCNRVAKIPARELSEAAGQPLPQATTGILRNASTVEQPVAML
jgi:ATP/ADP translocase